MHAWGAKLESRDRSPPRSFPQVRPYASRHPSHNRRRNADRLSPDEHSLITERSDARNLLPTTARLLREGALDIRVRARIGANRVCLRLRREARCVGGNFSFDARALCDGIRRGDDRVCFCVGLRMLDEEGQSERASE